MNTNAYIVSKLTQLNWINLKTGDIITDYNQRNWKVLNVYGIRLNTAVLHLDIEGMRRCISVQFIGSKLVLAPGADAVYGKSLIECTLAKKPARKHVYTRSAVAA